MLSLSKYEDVALALALRQAQGEGSVGEDIQIKPGDDGDYTGSVPDKEHRFWIAA